MARVWRTLLALGLMLASPGWAQLPYFSIRIAEIREVFPERRFP